MLWAHTPRTARVNRSQPPRIVDMLTRMSRTGASCNSVTNPFAFYMDTGMAAGQQQKCLNFFVGHMLSDCGGASSTCIDQFRPKVRAS